MTTIVKAIFEKEHSDRGWNVLLWCTVATDLVLLAILVGQRTDAALQTPWIGLPFGFFLLFAFSSALLLAGARHASARAFWVGALLHSLLTYTVALLVFRFGYGYDPIIHQAAEEHIVTQFTGSFNFILHPLDFILSTSHSPLYFGQYVVVSALHFLTSIPLRFIDRALLPMLSAVSVPIISYYGLRRAYYVNTRAARVLTLLVPLLAMPTLTFTTPYNLTVLLSLWWIFLLPSFQLGSLRITNSHESTNSKLPVTIFLIAAVAALTHPLLGVPLLLASGIAQVVQREFRLFPLERKKSKWQRECAITSISVTFFATALVVMFGVYRRTYGFPFLPSTSLLSALRELTATLVFRVSWTTAPWYLVAFYAIAWAIPFVIVLVGLRQLFSAVEYHPDPLITSLPNYSITQLQPWYRVTVLSLTLGLLLAVPFVYSAADIPGILESDQAEFARRLLLAIPIFFLPSFLLTYLRITNHCEFTNSRITIYPASGGTPPRRWPFTIYLFTAALLATSWYTTYPQVNAAVWRTGWNVAAHDIAAVKIIERDAAGQPYVVLSDRLFAAVGLRELGFDRRLTTQTGETVYPYAIAPNEPLFSYAQKFLSAKLTSDDLENLKRRTGVTRVYFGVHGYSSRLSQLTQVATHLGAEPVGNTSTGLQVFVLSAR